MGWERRWLWLAADALRVITGISWQRASVAGCN
jgi:hypothetical protein